MSEIIRIGLWADEITNDQLNAHQRRRGGSQRAHQVNSALG